MQKRMSISSGKYEPQSLPIVESAKTLIVAIAIQGRRNLKLNRCEFFLQTAGFLLAFVLTAGLLPRFSNAQGRPAPEAITKRAVAIVPLDGPALVGKPLTFRVNGNPDNLHWDLGDGFTAEGTSVTHTFVEPGVYHVVTGSKSGDTFIKLSSAIVRVHTPETLHLPQVILDTDARNEVDDQHYIAYGLFSNVDVLGINSAHHGPFRINHFGMSQEPINYGEILYVIELCRLSGLMDHRTENQIPKAFRGAKVQMQVPDTQNWLDTQPIESEASEAILAAARGASPDNPIWILPVGPCTNIASAILLAREEGLDLKSRIKIVWLGGGPERVDNRTHNGISDPWSVYVTAQSGLEFWILLEHPTGASITMDKNSDFGLYPDNRLGGYLAAIVGEYFKRIAPKNQKPLFDLTTISMVIGEYLEKPWLTLVEPSEVLGPNQQYLWKKVDAPSNVRIIRDIDEEAMKTDFFNTLNGKPTELPPIR
jgi:inosine-uridine nucleoside N-ribohydrolase